MISRDLEARILRLHGAEGWSIGTIARHLLLHHTVVERVVARKGRAPLRRPRPRKIDPYLAFLSEQLERYPRLAASVLYRMCRKRGYQGSERQLRYVVSLIRPRPPAEAYLRLRTLQGEQAQVDWGHFGQVEVGRGVRKLYGFVMVLSYSRRIFLRYFFGSHTVNFLRGHQEAFQAFGGRCPRTILYDNLKSCVLERYGDALRFHPLMLEFAAHYRFEPRPVSPARGNEKGRVERAIRFVRQSFFVACKWRDLVDLNRQALEWCHDPAFHRPWPEDRKKTVAQAFAEEQEHLLPTPAADYPLEERQEVSVGKTPYVRFDGNDYSVPHGKVRRTLVVRATESRVRVLEGAEVIARHERCWSKGEQIEDPEHIERLIREKRRARKHRGYDRLHHAAPSTHELLRRLAGRGENLGSATTRLLAMLDRYGAEALEDAVQEALAREMPHLPTVAFLLEKRRQDRQLPPPLPVELPDDPEIRELAVEPHSLAQYDQIGREEEEHDEQ